MWQPFLFGYAKACSDKGTTQKTHALMRMDGVLKVWTLV